MSRIRIREESDLPWIIARESAKPEDLERFSEGELNSKVRIRESGTADSPQLLEIEFAPDNEIRVHAHDEDEIIYIKAGTMHLGNRVLGPGPPLFVEGKTLYGFTAGQEGLTILNFRPRVDFTFHTRDECLAQRQQDKKAS